MTNKGSEVYALDWLLTLREKVIRRFVKNHFDKFDLATKLKSPSNNENFYYVEFTDDIKKSTDVKVSPSSIHKLLYLVPTKHKQGQLLKTHLSFEKWIIEAFEKYCVIIQTSNENIYSAFDHNRLQGSYIVDFEFVRKLKGIEIGNLHKDFFLSKNTDDLQWHGVVRNWDYPRKLGGVVKRHIIENFNQPVAVLAIVHGNGGSGKSTLLRRLASFELINEDLNVLWIHDLGHFILNDLKVLAGSTGKFLVIVEDWYSFKSNENNTSALLQRVSDFSNIKLVIGDRNPVEEAKYQKYTLGQSNFEISNEENKEIINKALSITNEWKNVKPIILTPEIYSASIYLILFVIAREIETNQYTDTRPYLNRFQDIVKHDFTIIEQSYPGLAITLHYFAHIYKFFKVRIIWSAVLKVADRAPNTYNAFKRLGDFNIDNPVIRILMHYISLKTFLNPDFSTLRYFVFHHDVLLEDGLQSVRLMSWHPYDRNIAYEVADVMWDEGEKNAAVDLITQLYVEDINKSTVAPDGIMYVDTNFHNIDIRNRLQKGELGHEGINAYLMIESFIESYYLNATKNKPEQYWINSLYFFMYKIGCTHASRLTILEKIIGLGCKSESVKTVYQFVSKKDFEGLYEYYNTVKVSRYKFRTDKDGRHFFGWLYDDLEGGN